MRIGQTFQSTDTRPFTAYGERKLHTRVTEWQITECDGEFLTAEAQGIVSEINRPDFAGYPIDTTMLVSSYQRRLATGEIVEV